MGSCTTTSISWESSLAKLRAGEATVVDTFFLNVKPLTIIFLILLAVAKLQNSCALLKGL